MSVKVFQANVAFEGQFASVEGSVLAQINIVSQHQLHLACDSLKTVLTDK